jgi:exodeoxyribonuclease III
MGAMKIATFNINNINKRLANLLSWLDATKPDVVCLQELKATDREFPKAALANAGYSAVWRGQKSWNGVAILARGIEPIVTRTLLPGDLPGGLRDDLPGGLGDEQARYIEAAVNGVLIASLYAPNGNPQPGPKFTYKLAWMDRLIAHAADLFAADVPVVLAGDFNVVPTDGDIYPTKSYERNALLQPESRARYARLLGQGWRDGIRTLNPDGPMYSYWSYLRNRWPRDAGLRIDHLLLSKPAAKRLVAAGVDRDVRDKDNASDHAPVWIELRDVVRGGWAKAPTGPARSGRPDDKLRAVPARPPLSDAPRGLHSAQPTLQSATKSVRKVQERRPLLVIDGDSFAHRAYHALPKSIRRKGDKPAGAILGFANLLLRLYREERPRAVLVGWDTYEEPTYRHEAFAAYQSGREFDDEVIEQLAVIPKFVAACGFANAKRAGYEADDFLAAAVAAEERRGGRALVASGDRDTFQLASDKTTILYPIRGGGMERIGPPEVRARYGVDPKQVPDFIALRGDPSDKLPGAPGVGASGAAALLQKYGSLTAILKAGRFPKQAEELRLYRAIATMNRKAPVPRLPDQTPTWANAAALARSWQLKQLAERLDELANAPARNVRR